MSEYKQVIFDILSPLTEQAEKELLADEPLKDQIMAMRKMSGTVQSIMNLYSRKHVLEGARIDVKMAELKKELEAARNFLLSQAMMKSKRIIIASCLLWNRL